MYHQRRRLCLAAESASGRCSGRGEAEYIPRERLRSGRRVLRLHFSPFTTTTDNPFLLLLDPTFA